jgi:hypothetical protein
VYPASHHVPLRVQSRLRDIGYAKEVLGDIVVTDDGLANCDGPTTDTTPERRYWHVSTPNGLI